MLHTIVSYVAYSLSRYQYVLSSRPFASFFVCKMSHSHHIQMILVQPAEPVLMIKSKGMAIMAIQTIRADSIGLWWTA